MTQISNQIIPNSSLVYFTVAEAPITLVAIIPLDGEREDILELFRSASEADPGDLLKLYTHDNEMIPINANLPQNTPEEPYRLDVICRRRRRTVTRSGENKENSGGDHEDDNLDWEEQKFIALEQRLSALESSVYDTGRPNSLDQISALKSLKSELTSIRTKLEAERELSWLGFYKILHPQLKVPKINHCAPCSKDSVIETFLAMSESNLSPVMTTLLSSPNFNSWAYSDAELLLFLYHIYLSLDMPLTFQFQLNTLKEFLVQVYRAYNDVPFHNFRHGFCVTQFMFCMINAINLTEIVSEMETFVLITSCICHDLDHNGYNNIYQINARTELAIRYNDISPLENHHVSVAFRILSNPSANIVGNLSPENFRFFREGMIRCILATDMARHNEIINQFRDAIDSAEGFDAKNDGHVNLLSMVLIKVADISNEARPIEISDRWLDCLFTEFFQQSDTEKLEGLPVTPFMDRDKVTKPQSQCSFIGVVLMPLFEVLVEAFSELEPLILAPVKYALDYYRGLLETNTNPSSFDRSGSLTTQQLPNASCLSSMDRSESWNTEEPENEVTVSEKAELKLFKITTSSSIDATSRKGSQNSEPNAISTANTFQSKIQSHKPPTKPTSFLAKLRNITERLGSAESMRRKQRKLLKNSTSNSVPSSPQQLKLTRVGSLEAESDPGVGGGGGSKKVVPKSGSGAGAGQGSGGGAGTTTTAANTGDSTTGGARRWVLRK